MDDPRDDLTALGEARRSAAFERYRVLEPFLTDHVPLSVIAVESGVALEAVMNSIRNGLGMGKTKIARKTNRPQNPHFYGIFTRVHNTL